MKKLLLIFVAFLFLTPVAFSAGQGEVTLTDHTGHSIQDRNGIVEHNGKWLYDFYIGSKSSFHDLVGYEEYIRGAANILIGQKKIVLGDKVTLEDVVSVVSFYLENNIGQLNDKTASDIVFIALLAAYKPQ